MQTKEGFGLSFQRIYLDFKLPMSQPYQHTLSKVIKKNRQKNALAHQVFSTDANRNYTEGI